MKAIRKLSPVLSLLVNLASCSTECDQPYQPLEGTDIAVGSLPANEVIPKQKRLITTEGDWQELLLEINSFTTTEGFSETGIDFNSYSVLAVFDETRAHTGYSIWVKEVLESSNHLLVKTATQNTEAGFTILIQPFHLVKINKPNKPVSFE